MKDSTDKGLLVVSFGTTHNDTCRETIGAIEEHLAKAMPDRRSYRGWTSSFIIRKLRERDGIEIDTVAEALDRMASDGIRDVLVVPTHLLAGAEYDKVMAAVEDAYEEDRGGDCPFERIAVSRPLLDTEEDLKRLAEVIAAELLGSDCDTRQLADAPTANSGQVAGSPDALVLMGHGSADKPEVNEVYVRLEEEFRRAGHDNVFVGTVEGRPSLDDLTDKLMNMLEDPVDASAGDVTHSGFRIAIAPLMIVAGDHAIKDMAGDVPDSWKNRIAATGAEAVPIIRGLGSYEGVQDMFLKKAREQM